MVRKAALRALLVSLVLGGALTYAQSSRVDVLDPRALPLGDGKVSAEPRQGHVYSCNTQFAGGGAQKAGNWIGASTWDATKKIWVSGEVAWPSARFEMARLNGVRRVTGNGLPMNHTTGTFPIPRGEPAFQFDRNPNSIAPQPLEYLLPLAPAAAPTPSCVPMGMIGVALSGVAIYNALDAMGRDAVAHEVQDRCSGHPQARGEYHYHGPSDCLEEAKANNALVGYAFDGFGIYSMYDERGRELTNADLDECHGRTSRIQWEGKEVSMYHYVLTREYPYTIGCFRGTPQRLQARFAPGTKAGRPPAKGGPPPMGNP